MLITERTRKALNRFLFSDVIEARKRTILIDESQVGKLRLLFERESNTSVESSKVVNFVSKYNFLLPYDVGNENVDTLVFYYNGKNLQQDFDKFAEIIRRSGWTISNYGTHYDGLRDFYLRYKNEHPEFSVGTFFASVETEYGTKMDDYFGTKDNELLNNADYIEDDNYWKKGFNSFEEDHLGIGYQRGVFYHLTERKNLRPILAHGLKPKNGGGITRWRSTSDRLYLSLLPDFNEVEYIYDDDEDDDDIVILRIDLRSVMKNFQFYVDNKYPNAVYTYSSIPSNFIEVINNQEIRNYHSQYFLRYAARQALEKVVKHNFSNYSIQDQKKMVEKNSWEIDSFIMPKLMLNYFKMFHIDDKYEQYISRIAKEEVQNFIKN